MTWFTHITGIVDWPSAFQAVDSTVLSIQCVLASYVDSPPTKVYLMLNEKSVPEISDDYEVRYHNTCILRSW